MEDRGDRRERTQRYAGRARAVWIQHVGRIDVATRVIVGKAVIVERALESFAKPLGRFAKGKSVGCRCRRHAPGNPKVTTSICAVGDHYLPSVRERIEGRRLARAWLRDIQAHFDPDDIEL